VPARCSLKISFLMHLQAFDKSGPYVRMLVEILKAIRWFMLVMLISILATWNSFTLLLKRQAACPEPDADASCEPSRDATSVFRTMYDMINTLLFGNGNLDTLENTEYFGLVVFIFIVSMIAMPIVLLNMLIAIMGDSYELIQVRFCFKHSIPCLSRARRIGLLESQS
jgi:hypothetical protein